MKKIAQFAIRFRWLVIIAFFGITVMMAMQMKKARFNVDLQTYLPEDMPSRVHQTEIENIFGGTQLLMIVIKTDDVINETTLKRVKVLSQEMKKIKGIEKVMSLVETKQVRNDKDAMLVDPAVRRIPRSPSEIETIKKEIMENDMVYGSVISEDFTTTAVIGMLEPGASDKLVVEQTEELVKKYPGTEETMLGGSPYLRVQNGSSMQRDISRLLPLGILLMLLFLFISFRQFRGVWLPTVVVFISIFISLGFIPLLGWDFTVVTIILPVLLIAVANDYGIHMFSHYQDDNAPGNKFTKKGISLRMVTSLGKPIVIAGITTMAGLLCMMGHILIPAWQMGILGAIGIAVALITSLLFVPAISSLLPKPKPIATPANSEGSSGLLNEFLLGISNLVTSKPRVVIYSMLAITIIIASGIFRLSINSNPARIFPEGHPAKISANLINNNLGGFFPLSIVFEGDIKNPELLKRIDDTERKIKAMPEVGTTQSLAKVTRQISRALNDEDDPQYDKIPTTYNAVAQYFELYMMSGDPDDLEKMVDFNFQKAMILVRFKDMNTPVLRKSVKKIKDMLKDDPNVKYIGGNADVFSEMDKRVVDGQFSSLIMSLFAIAIILSMAFQFRSFRGAILQLIPLFIAILILFGIMGYAGIELNFTTALLSSIMIGVGIDYTIHLVWRYREERRNGLEADEAIKQTIHTSGRGIILNAVSVIIGFSALIFSSFLSVRFFGILMVIMVFTCLVGGLLLVPALCIVFKPNFLEPGNKIRNKKEEEIEVQLEEAKIN
jgi:hydrophobe/amphiphile efflux-3 (HAE3) family protein